MDAVNAAMALMSRNLDLHPDKVAYFCEERTLTYRELERWSSGFARLLQKEGIAPGERVAIALPDCLAFPAVFLGCLLSGAVAVAVGADLSGDELSFIIEDSGARLLVTLEGSDLPGYYTDGVRVIPCGNGPPPQWSGAEYPRFIPHLPSADDIAYILYSSGSTGRPKGVPHRHGSLLLPCELVGRAIYGITGDDVILSTSKLPFTYGLINSLAFPLHFGAAAVLLPGKPDPDTILEIVRRRTPSIFFSVPSIYVRIVLSRTEESLKLPMRLCCSAGEALPASLFHEWLRLTGLEIVDGIGCTEMSYHFICNTPGRAVAGSAGRVVPGYRARLVDENGNDVAEGSEGNLLIRGETMSPFYWNQPEMSAEARTADGYLATGDVFVEKGGLYYHRGRSDDMIKVDALWVPPARVEAALRGHPAVADCAVAAVSVGGMVRPGAFVVLTQGTVETPGLIAELKARAALLLPEHMRPVRYRFMDELPRTATGKIQRFRLRGKG